MLMEYFDELVKKGYFVSFDTTDKDSVHVTIMRRGCYVKESVDKKFLYSAPTVEDMENALEYIVKRMVNKLDTNIDSTKTDCPWCSDKEYTIIDDDFGQPIHPKMIHYCFRCGKELI